MSDIHKKLNFLKEIDKFKSVYRMWYIQGQDRRENDAEHTRHMCMFAVLLQDDLWFPDVDLALTLKIILVHDLVEIYADDVFSFDEEWKIGKQERETEAAEKLFSQLPDEQSQEMMALRLHYEHQDCNEAKLAKTVDKLQALNQNDDGKLRQEEWVTEAMSRKHNSKVFYNEKIESVFEMYYKKAEEWNLFSKE